jgi:hypothetical protein
MPWRRTRIALAIYLFAWFGIIVPGHRRGVVVFDGAKTVSDCCCCCCDHSDAATKSNTPGNQSAHCEICNFAAHLTLPPVVNLNLFQLGLLEKAPKPAEHQPVWRIVLTPFDSRGPPFIASASSPVFL